MKHHVLSWPLRILWHQKSKREDEIQAGESREEEEVEEEEERR
jgi:hypothetical protein